MKRILLLFLGLSLTIVAKSQETFPFDGVNDKRPEVYALTNATIHTDFGNVITNGTIIIRKGRIESVGAGIAIPKEATVISMQGKHLYPSFVEIYSSYGLPEPDRAERFRRTAPAQYEPATKGPYNWNDAIKPNYRAVDEFTKNTKKADVLIKSGFGSVLSHKGDGIARGTSVFATLAKERRDNELVLKTDAAAHYSFDKGSSSQQYPSSLMGSIALLRQTYYDVAWFQNQNPKPYTDATMDTWVKNQALPQIFEVTNHLNLLRADKVGDEFGVQYIIKGKGDEYKRLDIIKATNASLIVPVKYPKAFEVDDPLDAYMVSLEDMKHWEMAPANAGMLSAKGIRFALTSEGIDSPADFLANVRKAVKYGLSEADALRALTTTPAELIRMADQVGSLKKGLVANILVTDGNLFEEKTRLLENWVQGERNILVEWDVLDLAGKYDLKLGNRNLSLEITGKPGSQSGKVKVNDSTDLSATISLKRQLLTMTFPSAKDSKELVRLTGWVDGKTIKGDGQEANGAWISWSATYKEAASEDKKEEDKKDEKPELGKLWYPFIAFGNESRPTAKTYLIKNATVWTNEAEGNLTETDVLVQNGKIARIGKNLPATGATVIDGTGKHLTTGIIDEHSHIAISQGVNESAQSITAEVRIGDVVNPDDINIYRQLAGGVTGAQLLHGSANAIGGQSALIKLKWGVDPEEMKIPGADGFIKFALGENVKQSNWGVNNTRYPQTRMGVEQVFYDGFTRAKEYDAAWKAYNALPAKQKATAKAPRRDLELETLAEILNEKRFISCHSYVQSEINMLIKAADDLGFKVNTFTHILEGYKVADQMKKHGAGGSTFADWWAYKFEVREAIPYNAALMHGQGVVTAINSDDAEMGRRLNQEAAKTIKYGGLSEEEAWKTVTLNPAKLLHLDNRLGSIKAGKDADLVLWSGNPLSIYSTPEITMVEGVVYFDRAQDQIKREENEKERIRLIQSMKSAKAAGAPTQKPSPRRQHIWHCDDVHDAFADADHDHEHDNH